MNNDIGVYTEEPYKKLASDISTARAEGLTLLIFRHEPLSTGKPEDTNIEFIRIGDKNSPRNFYSGGAGSAESNATTMKVYRLITESANVIKGSFCGYKHNDIYTEIKATSFGKEDFIPQHTVTANAYDAGNVLHIIVD